MCCLQFTEKMLLYRMPSVVTSLMNYKKQVYAKPDLSIIDVTATNSGDPSFPQEGFFSASGLPADNIPVGPNPS